MPLSLMMMVVVEVLQLEVVGEPQGVGLEQEGEEGQELGVGVECFQQEEGLELLVHLKWEQRWITGDMYQKSSCHKGQFHNQILQMITELSLCPFLLGVLHPRISF